MMTNFAKRNLWIDLSVPLYSGMVHWPGDPEIEITRPLDMANGDPCTVSRLSLGSHTGTHMDAPLHFIKRARAIDELPFDATIGPARVIEICHPVSIRPEELKPHRIRRGERILFKTRNSQRCWKTDRFVEDFVAISQDAARYLAACRPRCVGVDHLSIGGYHDNGVAIHQALLGAGIWIIEGLNLAAVNAGRYELICLPLRLRQGDGALARAIARRLRGGRSLPRWPSGSAARWQSGNGSSAVRP